MSRFFLIFLSVLAVLFGAEMLNPVQHALIHPWTSLLAHWSSLLMTPFDPDILSQGRVLMSRSTGFGVSIEAGCNGIEAVIILTAAIVAFPAPWKLKCMGIAAGFVAIQAINILRIVSLYYLGQWNFQLFEFAHLYLWQALIMLDVLIVWLLWIRAVARQSDAGNPA